MSFAKLTPEQLRLHKGISFTGITTVFICHDGIGQVLLGKRSLNARDEHGHWDFGAGGLKHGQSLEDNLKREMKEEYNVQPTKIEFVGYLDAFRKNDTGLDTHWLAMYFCALINPKQVKLNEPDIIDELGWFKLHSLPRPMHSQFKLLNQIHGDKLKEIIGS
jgi:8-oxo-dGTP diphosphatase